MKNKIIFGLFSLFAVLLCTPSVSAQTTTKKRVDKATKVAPAAVDAYVGVKDSSTILISAQTMNFGMKPRVVTYPIQVPATNALDWRGFFVKEKADTLITAYVDTVGTRHPFLQSSALNKYATQAALADTSGILRDMFSNYTPNLLSINDYNPSDLNARFGQLIEPGNGERKIGLETIAGADLGDGDYPRVELYIKNTDGTGGTVGAGMAASNSLFNANSYVEVLAEGSSKIGTSSSNGSFEFEINGRSTDVNGNIYCAAYLNDYRLIRSGIEYGMSNRDNNEIGAQFTDYTLTHRKYNDQRYARLSKGTTAQRPVLSNIDNDKGYMYFNTTVSKFQGWTGTAWVDLH